MYIVSWFEPNGTDDSEHGSGNKVFRFTMFNNNVASTHKIKKKHLVTWDRIQITGVPCENIIDKVSLNNGR